MLLFYVGAVPPSPRAFCDVSSPLTSGGEIETNVWRASEGVRVTIGVLYSAAVCPANSTLESGECNATSIIGKIPTKRPAKPYRPSPHLQQSRPRCRPGPIPIRCPCHEALDYLDSSIEPSLKPPSIRGSVLQEVQRWETSPPRGSVDPKKYRCRVCADCGRWRRCSHIARQKLKISGVHRYRFSAAAELLISPNH